ncbi:MAG TPA: glycoside hydrolase family 57 protein [Candidatus Saccharimonadales bacterium]|nr:glycoside hydrolase family 57 protein [Candidatus Saccharimonadales bacterium]
MSAAKAICLYLHVHQPYRVRHYSIFDAGADHNYFYMAENHPQLNNQNVLRKVADKSYIPTNQRLLRMLQTHPEFCLSLSLTGTLLEQLEQWAPEALASFQGLVATGRVEIVAETYYHSLAFFYSRFEFEKQIRMHRDKIKQLFGQTPKILRNTELSYNNDLAYWADKAGYKGILTEGWGKVLGWRSANHVYRPAFTDNIRLLMKNYKLSDDIAFRFSDRTWSEWPLTTEKFVHWMMSSDEAEVINLFMDYETFGEHQWGESGIFDFLEHLPQEFTQFEGNRFLTPSQVIDTFEARDFVDVPETITWADTERDLSAWVGNDMQQTAIAALYKLENEILATSDQQLIADWRRLQTSDHFYYMCTKWFNDGDIHAYFSPYETPYEGFIAFMNVLRDLRVRIDTIGTGKHAYA